MKAARSHGSALEFIMRDRGVDRQRDRSDLRRRPQPQVDARDIAVGSPLLQQLDHPPRNAHRRLAGIVALAFRQGLGVEQQEQVDVGRIIELAAAELAHGDHGKAGRLGVGHPLADRGSERAMDRAVGEGGEQLGHRFERELAGEIAERDRQREAEPLAAELDVELVGGCAQRALDRGFSAALLERVSDVGQRPQRLAQERRVELRAAQRVRSRSGGGRVIHRNWNAANLVDTKLPASLARFQSE